MSEAIAKALLVYGPLGIIALASMIAAVKMYKDKQAMSERHEKERKEWEERYVTKAETWVEKYHEFAKAANAVIEAALRRIHHDRNGDDRR